MKFVLVICHVSVNTHYFMYLGILPNHKNALCKLCESSFRINSKIHQFNTYLERRMQPPYRDLPPTAKLPILGGKEGGREGYPMCSNTFTAVRILMGTSCVTSTGTVKKKPNVKLRYVEVTINKSSECLPSGMVDFGLDKKLGLPLGTVF